ncbi:DUF202 domain-containing protein [Streptomyces sp. NPDC097619]|uniref:DUF202 domain-containing protein n=1 Tax=Streptomyces sp. NPDC097619 TaxID=3157228 RepID=UPI0033253EDE
MRDGSERDPGLQPERTRLAWRRTTLTGAAVAVLAVKQAAQGDGDASDLTATALTVLVWLLFLGVAHRRIRGLSAARPKVLDPRAAAAVTLCAVALGGLAIALIL